MRINDRRHSEIDVEVGDKCFVMLEEHFGWFEAIYKNSWCLNTGKSYEIINPPTGETTVVGVKKWSPNGP